MNQLVKDVLFSSNVRGSLKAVARRSREELLEQFGFTAEEGVLLEDLFERSEELGITNRNVVLGGVEAMRKLLSVRDTDSWLDYNCSAFKAMFLGLNAIGDFVDFYKAGIKCRNVMCPGENWWTIQFNKKAQIDVSTYMALRAIQRVREKQNTITQ